MNETRTSPARKRLPRVSVVVPVYNAAPFLESALDSILAQSYPADHIEVIVIDDGSSDDSLKIADRYSDRLHDLKICSQPNGGVSSARNLGIMLSNGELIAFLDADDRWRPDKLKAQVSVFDADPSLGLVHCGCAFVDESGTPIPGWSRQSRLDQGDILLEFVCDFFLITSTVMVPRSVLDIVGGFDEGLKVGEDNERFLRILSKYHAGCATDTLTERTVRAGSLSRQDYDLDARTDLQILGRFLQSHPIFASQHKQRIDNHLSSYLFSYGYRLLEDGRVEQAREVLRRSLKVSWSSRASRTLIRSYLPARLAGMTRTLQA
jgi:glycosyltransferase involved in cell wall biosynthesis